MEMIMSGQPKPLLPVGICPFCGLAADVSHETQEGCIAALHEEIARMRNILANARPTRTPQEPDDRDSPARHARLALDRSAG